MLPVECHILGPAMEWQIRQHCEGCVKDVNVAVLHRNKLNSNAVKDVKDVL